MDKLNIFIPLAKFDAARRRAYGVMTAETPDKSGEIMDYATGKPAIQLWSESLAKATDGKNKGNVRVMHGRAPKFGALPVGRVIEIDFDDLNKSVSVCVEVDDDDALAMCEKGTLTGFSIGGGYAKRWADGLHKRYTPILNELSLVDNPCLGGASFELVKADGIVEKVLLTGFDPGSDATKAYADVLAKAAGKEDRRNDFLVQARDDLIKAHVDDGQVFAKGDDGAWAMTKVADDAAADDGGQAQAEADAPALEKAEDAPADPAALVAAALEKAQAASESPAPEKAGGAFADLVKLSPVLIAMRTQADAANPLAKSLYTLEWMAELMSNFKNLTDCMIGDAFWDGVTPTNAETAKSILAQIGTLFLDTAREEVAEATTVLKAASVEFTSDDAGVLALAKEATESVLADLPLMEKVGARNSKADAGRIKAIHDHACALGAECTESDVAEKLAKSESEIGRLTKALTEALPGIERLGATVAAQAELLTKAQQDNTGLADRIKTLEAQPMPGKGVLRVIGKEEDVPGLRKAAGDPDDETMTPLQKALSVEDDPIKRAGIILRFSGGAVPGQGDRA